MSVDGEEETGRIERRVSINVEGEETEHGLRVRSRNMLEREMRTENERHIDFAHGCKGLRWRAR